VKLSKVLLASIFITVSVLVTIGGLVGSVLANKAPNQAAAEATMAVATVQAYQQREVAYNQLVQQANQQLEKANSDLQSMQKEIAQLKQPPAAQNASKASISAASAEEIAIKSVAPGMQPLKAPELVSFEGKTAYEVAFEKGSVYINAEDGTVIFNETIPQQITAEKAAQIASDYLKIKDVLQVDQITFHNAPLFRVILGNGTMVFMDLTGQITYIEAKAKPPSVVVVNDSAGESNQSNSSAPAAPQPPQPREPGDQLEGD
jgi:hypothetical protein